ncbi:trypanothione synthetase [Strigomonas culicis]|uniref:Trypanothione synthetase n=1 Tax=Strigomonas culicis TaxID=28005 RepID=S9VDV7_9TRYP|nr:trypanothione synthetase [Strigomonas culicis]|eukprot:EPY21260.1 trypanothione synthetase [Strigomonas culicis]
MSTAQVLSPRIFRRSHMGNVHCKTSSDSVEDTEFAERDYRVARKSRKLLEPHGVCGTTVDGVYAYSNGDSNRWDSGKHYQDGLFMGFKWQCVEFARRWLWTTRRLLLPQRNCAYGFGSLKRVYRPHLKEGVDVQRELQAEDWAPKAEWEKVSVRYVKQGSRLPPQPNSLIIYPMACGSPWGHIGVITNVDLARRLVYVADQNRYFHEWNDDSYSEVFKLEEVNGKYYIRDPESECKGWIEFDN